jgi:hypothetical protein
MKALALASFFGMLSGALAKAETGVTATPVRLLASKYAPEFAGVDGAVYLPSATSAGNAAFLSQLSASRDLRIFETNQGNAFTELARTSTQAPGAPDGVEFFGFSDPLGCDQGVAAFFAVLTGPGVDASNNHGIWISEEPGKLKKIMRAGDQVPGLADSTYFSPLVLVEPSYFEFNRYYLPFSYTLIANHSGEVAFFALMHGLGAREQNDRALFVHDASGLRVVARRGDPVRAENSGVTFANFGSPSLNDHGDVTFFAGLDGTLQDRGIFLGAKSKAPQAIVVSGEAAPHAGLGVTFLDFQAPRLNNAGHVAFVASFAGEGVNLSNDSAIYSGKPDRLALLAREGLPAPGVIGTFGPFGFIGALAANPIINNSGLAAFSASLSGPEVDESNDSGLWAQDAHGALKLIAREGDAAPGGGVFGDLAPYYLDPTSTRIQINSSGQIAFFGSVVFPDSTTRFIRGIWATTRNGELKLIAREGSALQFQTSTGNDSELIDELFLPPNSGGQDGFASGFTDAGIVVFWARYRDSSSAIFASDAVAIPEPSAVGLALTAGLVVCVVGRRRDYV